MSRKGWYGYGKEYRLTVPPRLILGVVSPKRLELIDDEIKIRRLSENLKRIGGRYGRKYSGLDALLDL